MIRREIRLPRSEPQWALISQVEHAHLAADLARHWRFPLVPSGLDAKAAEAVQRELLEAIEHHDDGWAQWEEAPDVDPKHGRPRSFTEMPQADSLAIWSKSIAVAEQIGPLSAWIVSGHFSALLRGGSGREDASDHGAPAAQWIDRQRSCRDAWMKAWLQGGTRRSADVAEEGLRALQFFDAASLWFCCTCPAEDCPTTATGGDASLTFADGGEFHFSFPSVSSTASPGRSVSIRPWPFATEHLHLSVNCRRAPVDRYETASDLLRAWEPRRLTWRLTATDSG